MQKQPHSAPENVASENHASEKSANAGSVAVEQKHGEGNTALQEGGEGGGK